jgi:hypothetical protein
MKLKASYTNSYELKASYTKKLKAFRAEVECMKLKASYTNSLRPHTLIA